MKTNTITSFSNKICYFKAIKYKLNNYCLILKKIINIIFKLILNYKKILFLGINKKYYGFLKFIKLKTNHIFIPINFWLNGLLTNLLINKHLYFIKNLKFLLHLKLKHNFSLIIVFNKFKFKNEIISSNLLSVVFFTHFINKFFSFNISNKVQDSLFLLLIYLLLNNTNNKK